MVSNEIRATLVVLTCFSLQAILSLLFSSCWSGSVAPSPGWRTGPQRTPCKPCSRNWRTSATTAACTSPPRSKRSANSRSISTPCRPSCGSATGQPSCLQKGKWSRWVAVTAHKYSNHAWKMGLLFSPWVGRACPTFRVSYSVVETLRNIVQWGHSERGSNDLCFFLSEPDWGYSQVACLYKMSGHLSFFLIERWLGFVEVSCREMFQGELYCRQVYPDTASPACLKSGTSSSWSVCPTLWDWKPTCTPSNPLEPCSSWRLMLSYIFPTPPASNRPFLLMLLSLGYKQCLGWPRTGWERLWRVVVEWDPEAREAGSPGREVPAEGLHSWVLDRW